VEKILPYERDLFLWLNGLHTSYWDVFMWIYSGKLIWLPLAVVGLGVFVYKVKWQEAVLLLACAVLIGILCDYVSASVIKPFFERPRPTHHPDFQTYVEVVKNYRGGKYGFISNHAANNFGIAAFTSLLFRYRYYTITIILWATITAYSRIYLGVHFISDVAGGAIWGILTGSLVYYVYLTSQRYILKVPEKELKMPVYPKVRAQILMCTILVIVVAIAVYSALFNIPE
jgi:undecaprenyl-diphosphatase